MYHSNLHSLRTIPHAYVKVNLIEIKVDIIKYVYVQTNNIIDNNDTCYIYFLFAKNIAT